MLGPMTTLLLLGATGLVGGEALVEALQHPSFTTIIAPTRRALPAELLERAGARLINPIGPLEAFELSNYGPIDTVVCAIGSTRKKAGSKEAFRAIDHGLVLELAAKAKAAGATHLAYVSSVGANPEGTGLYLRVKGEVERDLAGLHFKRLSILRPAGLLGEREESRPLETVFLGLTKALPWLIPARYRSISADTVAKRLVSEVLQVEAGHYLIQNEAIAH